MRNFIIKNVSTNSTVELTSTASTFNELVGDLEDSGNGDHIPVNSKVVLRPERKELSHSSTFPDRSEILINVFASKLDAGK